MKDSVYTGVRHGPVFRIPKNRAMLMLRLPALIWFFGLGDIILGRDHYGLRIVRWGSFKGLCHQVIDAFNQDRKETTYERP